jgi:hypothetical protein
MTKFRFAFLQSSINPTLSSSGQVCILIYFASHGGRMQVAPYFVAFLGLSDKQKKQPIHPKEGLKGCLPYMRYGITCA